MTSPNPPEGEELVERISIGLFAAYDDLSLSCAEDNWRQGFAYGAVGSDGHTEITETARRVAEALAPALQQLTKELEEAKARRVIADVEWSLMRSELSRMKELVGEVLEPFAKANLSQWTGEGPVAPFVDRAAFRKAASLLSRLQEGEP